MPSKRTRALKMIEDHVAHLKEEGVREIEFDRSVLQPRAARPAAPVPQRPSTPTPRAPISPSPQSAPPPIAPPLHHSISSNPAADLEDIASRIAACRKCGLCKTRTRTVPGQGTPKPEIMFVGEGPGTDEDQQGLAFIGRAGQLLTRMITAMGFSRDEVFIGNIVKCRPTVDNAGEKDRPPTPEEMAACIPYLREQIAVLKPKVIVALGATAVKGLFGEGQPGITRLRGTWLQYEGIEVMPTFHPSYLLRQGGDSKGGNQAYWDVWSDLVKALEKIGRTPPAKRS